MNTKVRADAIRAMDYLARCINDETILERWFMCGVADGDIDEKTTDEDLLCYTLDDEAFADIMNLFERLISMAHLNGGLYIDDIVM